MKRKTGLFETIMVLIIFNFIVFTASKFRTFKEKYHIFYECKLDDRTVVYNGKEFKLFKKKYEASNKMSPDCIRIK